MDAATIIGGRSDASNNRGSSMGVPDHESTGVPSVRVKAWATLWSLALWYDTVDLFEPSFNLGRSYNAHLIDSALMGGVEFGKLSRHQIQIKKHPDKVRVHHIFHEFCNHEAMKNISQDFI